MKKQPLQSHDYIRFCDLTRRHRKNLDEYTSAVSEVIASSDFCNGRFVKAFEREYADYCGTRFAGGVSNGTDAVFLALRALGIGRGDEVIVPANTFVASAWGVVYNAATPVFCDCTRDTWEIDAESAERLITKKTRAIIGVNLYGQTFDYNALSSVADAYGLPIVEDSAQAHGALYDGRRAGSLGTLGCFSFYPSKNLGACGDAGCVVSDNAEYIEKINKLKIHAFVPGGGDHSETGYNMRMDDIQAAVLSCKLKALDGDNEKRFRIAQKYIGGITNPRLTKQSTGALCTPVYHLFVVTVADRNAFISHMNDCGVECRVHYSVPCHLMQAFSQLGYREGSLPNSEYLSAHCVSLPLYPELSDEETDRIIDACNSFVG